jgi:hypothetical protein
MNRAPQDMSYSSCSPEWRIAQMDKVYTRAAERMADNTQDCRGYRNSLNPCCMCQRDMGKDKKLWIQWFPHILTGIRDILH